MGIYRDFLDEVKRKNVPDGTYICNDFNPENLKKKTFETGYQVSFMRPEDQYTDEDIASIITEIRAKLGSDIYVGVFEREPELSFYCASPVINSVTKIMKRYNQHSIYNWTTKSIVHNVHYDQVKDCLAWE